MLVHHAARSADAVVVCLPLLSWSTCPENAPVALPSPKWKSWSGQQLCRVFYYGELWPNKKGKMLDPSGCFLNTKPGISELVLLGSRPKIQVWLKIPWRTNCTLQHRQSCVHTKDVPVYMQSTIDAKSLNCYSWHHFVCFKAFSKAHVSFDFQERE